VGADVTIYCLQSVTDYFQFERLCHDLMSLEGYHSIEPLGGFSDKGRDAVHVDRAGRTTIFAYSVREDWRAKLAEDAAKIKKYGHTCDRLVFITTATFTAGERDEAVNYIQDEFGWELDLYGAERLRILLDVQYSQVKANHPHIFPPALLAAYVSPSTPVEADHIFISYAPEDVVLAEWLTRKLMAEGYLVWCERLNLLGGETCPDDIDKAMKHRTFRVVALYSHASLRNPEVMRQRALALSIGSERNIDFLIPINVDGVTPDQLDHAARSLVFIPFEQNWASGLQQLLKKLESIACPRPLFHGRAVAAQSFLEKEVLSDRPELLVSNCLRVERLPEAVHRFEAGVSIPEGNLKQLQFVWAYRRVNPTLFLSFHQPPPSITKEYRLRAAGDQFWQHVRDIDGIRSEDLVSELLRKSLIVKCHERGLRYCPDTRLHYFPWGLVEGGRLKFVRPDGSRSTVRVTGQRKFWRPAGSEQYRYHLAPVFSVAQDLFDKFVVLVYVRVRLADTSGRALPRRTAISRRKHLCKDWWNKEWLDRLLAICQYLADDGKIVIGKRWEEQIILNASPLSLEAPVGVNEDVLDRL